MRIGTRGERARARAGGVGRRAARGAGVECELVHVTTAGDRGEQLSDKSRWVSELERALLAGEIDVAVHSAKDVPAELADRTELAAIPAREDPRDVICGAGSLDRVARSGHGSARAASGARRSCGRCVTTSRSSGCAATSTRGCASSPPARSTRWCWRSLACAGSAASDEAGGVLDELVPAAGQGALACRHALGRVGACACHAS